MYHHQMGTNGTTVCNQYNNVTIQSAQLELSIIHLYTLASSAFPLFLESIYYFHLFIHLPPFCPFRSCHININQSFNFSTFHQFFLQLQLNSSALLIHLASFFSLLPAHRRLSSLIYPLLISSSLLPLYILHIFTSQSIFSIRPAHPSHTLSLSLRVFAGLWIARRSIFSGQLAQKLSLATFFFLYSKWKSHTGNNWPRPFLLNSN